MQQLLQYVNHGWPQSCHDSHPATRPYFNIRDQTTFQDWLLLNGLRIIIPKKLRAEMKKLLHTGYIGIEKTKTRVRETMCWPNINGEIEDMIKTCSMCQEHQNQQSSEPMIPHDIAAIPWQKVAIGLFSLWKKDYIIIPDYRSKFFHLSQLEDTNVKTVVMHLNASFQNLVFLRKLFQTMGHSTLPMNMEHLSVTGILTTSPAAQNTLKAMASLSKPFKPQKDPKESTSLWWWPLFGTTCPLHQSTLPWQASSSYHSNEPPASYHPIHSQQHSSAN